MTLDRKGFEEQRNRILGLIQRCIPPNAAHSDETAIQVFNSFVELTPPTEPEIQLHLLTMRPSGVGGGQSRKPGNIYLHWKKLFDVFPDVTIAVAGATASPYWLIPFIALYVWNKLWCGSAETLTENEASVIFALWKHRNNENRISEDAGFEKCNKIRESAKFPLLTRHEFDVAMNRLVSMGCVEIESGIIWLREWVCIQY